MGSNSKWVAAIAAVCLATFGGVACGGDSDDGGTNGGICDPKSRSFDQQACMECGLGAAMCMFAGVCGDEFGAMGVCQSEKCEVESEAASDCADAAGAGCEAKHPDDFGAYQDCIHAACKAEDDALTACGQAKCPSEAAAIVACFKRDCPEGAACFDTL